MATRVPVIWWFYNFPLFSIVFYGGRYSVGTVNFKGKAARVPLKENFGRNFFCEKFFRLRKTVPKSKCFNMQIYEILCIDFVWKRNLGKERSWFSCRSFPFGASRTRAQSASVMRAMVRGDFFISLDNRVYRKLAGSPSGQQVSDRRKAIIGTNVLCVNLRRDNAAWWGRRLKILVRTF